MRCGRVSSKQESHCTKVNVPLSKPWKEVVNTHSWNGNQGPLMVFFFLFSSAPSFPKWNACVHQALPMLCWTSAVLRLTLVLPVEHVVRGSLPLVLTQSTGSCLGEEWPGKTTASRCEMVLTGADTWRGIRGSAGEEQREGNVESRQHVGEGTWWVWAVEGGSEGCGVKGGAAEADPGEACLCLSSSRRAWKGF